MLLKLQKFTLLSVKNSKHSILSRPFTSCLKFCFSSFAETLSVWEDAAWRSTWNILSFNDGKVKEKKALRKEKQKSFLYERWKEILEWNFLFKLYKRFFPTLKIDEVFLLFMPSDFFCSSTNLVGNFNVLRCF